MRKHPRTFSPRRIQPPRSRRSLPNLSQRTPRCTLPNFHAPPVRRKGPCVLRGREAAAPPCSWTAPHHSWTAHHRSWTARHCSWTAHHCLWTAHHSSWAAHHCPSTTAGHSKIAENRPLFRRRTFFPCKTALSACLSGYWTKSEVILSQRRAGGGGAACRRRIPSPVA